MAEYLSALRRFLNVQRKPKLVEAIALRRGARPAVRDQLNLVASLPPATPATTRMVSGSLG